MTGAEQINDIVDLDRYPIADADAPDARALIEEGRRRLADDGLFTLPGFIRPPSLTRMQTESNALVARGHYHERYRDGIHPGEIEFSHASRVSVTCTGLDEMGPGSDMRGLYLWDGLTDFIAEVLERHPYYRSADAIVGCMLTAFGVGDELGWHFDGNDGVVSLVLQEAGEGGAFEFAPFVWKGDDGGIEAVDAVMAGCFEGLVRARYEPGTLSLFQGSRSLHRVAPVVSNPQRIMLLFSYESQPGQQFPDSLRSHFFGRTEPVSQRPRRSSAGSPLPLGAR